MSKHEAALQAAGQHHLIEHLRQAPEHASQRLDEQLDAIDLAEIQRLHQGGAGGEDIAALAARAEPPPAIRLGASENPYTAEEATAAGRELLAAGKVGAVLVAGGEGTRLDFPHPKGMYPVGPVSKRSLYQIFCDQLKALAARYGHGVPLYVMTSPSTHQPTADFFQQHQNFGLPADDLRLFMQGTMPAVDAKSGKLLLAGHDSLSLSPAGHGSMLAALVDSGSLAECQQRGLEQLFYFQVDNPLVSVADPEFMGYHALAESEMSTQVVAKHNAEEKVGNVVSVDGQVRIIEYSDLPQEAAERTSDDGSLALWAGNVAVHAFTVEFLERMSGIADSLPWHLAHKKVSHLSTEGELIEPEEPNAIKFERFIFDLLPKAKNAIVVEVDPAKAFAPVKNKPGSPTDTPEAAQAAMVALYREWLAAAGAEVSEEIAVEISPLFALDAEELAGKIEPGQTFTSDTFLSP